MVVSRCKKKLVGSPSLSLSSPARVLLEARPFFLPLLDCGVGRLVRECGIMALGAGPLGTAPLLTILLACLGRGKMLVSPPPICGARVCVPFNKSEEYD